MTFDVTNQLQAGVNAMGVMLGNGRFFAPRQEHPITTVSYGYPKLLLQFEVEYADGTKTVVTATSIGG